MKFIFPLSLYVHIPWCVKKCPFCDLNTCKIENEISKKKYVEMLIQDLTNDKIFFKNRIIKTIFIGGGTPNLLNVKLINFLITKIKKITKIEKKIEISIEIHPQYTTFEQIIQYQKIGINRISIGLQSFNPKYLKKIGRKYSIQNITKILYQIKKYTNINTNIDLMYGLPDQNIQDCLDDLYKAISIQPDHISWYQMSIEKNTIFYYQKPKIPNEKIISTMYNLGKNVLKKNKYIKYEISSYAKKKHLCYHNLNYWNFGDYLGIGCGAHSKITKKNGDVIRFIKKKRIYDYCNKQQLYIDKIYHLSKKDKFIEYFMNTARLSQPIKKKNFYKHTQIDIKEIKKYIKKAILENYILEKNNCWIISEKGKNFLNDLILLFI
ncbi:radical SAM family heme chaperone HemW [Buchnera aphidicola]|uniref:radical SAM family heme chaperone HemW n=1 Tax=Buchnera aphidicola TaxID=9 RepID=UPI0031B880C4